MKLFDEDDRYTEEALTLDKAVADSLKPLFKEYAEYGYSIREIAHIAHSTVLELECDYLLGWDAEFQKEESKDG